MGVAFGKWISRIPLAALISDMASSCTAQRKALCTLKHLRMSLSLYCVMLGRAMSIMLALIFVVGLSGCESKDRVAQAREAATTELAGFGTSSPGELAENVHDLVSDFVGGTTFSDAFLGQSSCEIGDVSVSGKEATVTVSLKSPDVSWMFVRALSNVPAYYTTLTSLSTSGLTTETASMFAAVLTEEDVQSISAEIEIMFERDGDVWTPNDDAATRIASALLGDVISDKEGSWEYTKKTKLQIARLWAMQLCQLADDATYMERVMDLGEDVEAELAAADLTEKEYFGAILTNAQADVAKVDLNKNIATATIHAVVLDSDEASEQANDAIDAYAQTDEAYKIYSEQGEDALETKFLQISVETMAAPEAPTVEVDETFEISFSGLTVTFDDTNASNYVYALLGTINT